MRGQISSLDAMGGLGGLILIVLLSLVLFSSLYDRMSLTMDKKAQELASFYAMEQLMGAGEPANWQYSSAVRNYGLAREPGVLDISKISALISANHSLVAERLGLSKYNFSVEILDFYNNSVLYSTGSANSSNMVSVQRVSSLNGSLVLVRLKVAS